MIAWLRTTAKSLACRQIVGDVRTIDGVGVFDLVSFNKVLEHVHDPVEMLASVDRLLVPGGLVYVELPDGEAAEVEGKEREEFLLGHMHVFSFASYALLIANAGFELHDVRTAARAEHEVYFARICAGGDDSVKIRHIAFVSPDNRVGNDIVAEWSGLKREFLVNKIGVESRGFLTGDEKPIDLAIAACEKLLAADDAPNRETIGLVVMVTQNPDYRIPHSSALLQQALGLPLSTAAFDIGLGCSGYVYALSAVKGMMQAEDIENASACNL